MNSPNPPRIVACGAGVIGAATAYFLSLRGVAVTVVERADVACAASGKAGGFLALDWCDGSPLRALARKSFALHAELAQTLETDYGYRRLTTLAVAAGERGFERPGEMPEELAWLDGSCIAHSVLGTPRSTAQVHPEKFTRALLQTAEACGTRLLIGCVEGLELSDSPQKIKGVRINGQIIPADAVVIAMGPWSNAAADWLPIPPIRGLKGHSITLRPDHPIPAQALFVEYETIAGEHLSPEVYPRPDGEVYVCGLSDYSSLPTEPGAVQPRPEARGMLLRAAAGLSSALSNLEPETEQACFRPVYDDGLPLLGRVPGVAGAYIATGHSCWGILNAPASGLALAELIVDGHAECVDLAPYDPRRGLSARAAAFSHR